MTVLFVEIVLGLKLYFLFSLLCPSGLFLSRSLCLPLLKGVCANALLKGMFL